MNLIHKIDFALIFLSVFGMIFMVGYISPMIISPIDGFKTSNSEILFSIDKADYLLIDDNFEFTTPDKYPLTEGTKINLQAGKYFWKAVGVLDSEVRTITIESEVNLQLKKMPDENYGVFNAGNVNLNVEVYNGTNLVETKKLSVNNQMKMTGNKFIGKNDE